MRALLVPLVLFCGSISFAKVVVFWQDGFPTAESQPIGRAALTQALDRGGEPVFASLDRLRDPATLENTDLLVLPYGSATPVDVWPAIRQYLGAGGNLLVVGGRPFRVPVTRQGAQFVEERPRDAYAREIGIVHTYAIPTPAGARFAWKNGYSFLGAESIRAQRFFAVEGGVDGLGYMVDADRVDVAAPAIVENHTNPARGMLGSRIVMLDFDPRPGYWDSPEGIALVRAAANYARQGAAAFSVEMQLSTIKPGEIPEMIVHLRDALGSRPGLTPNGSVRVDLLANGAVLDTANLPVSGASFNAEVDFPRKLAAGFYAVRATWLAGGTPRESYTNGFWVEDRELLDDGPALGVDGDFLTRDGKPFFPFGTNYFTTENYNWDFSGPRNAWVWDRDFAEMARNGVSFVRTGVWMPYLRFVEPSTGMADQRFLRNLEAFLLCARRHGIAVNFTFFAFMPRGATPPYGPSTNPPNPYLNPASIRAEQDYILSIVQPFKDDGALSWDLINEPSFSNPRRLWKGNTPNDDPVELRLWREWLRKKYGNIGALAAAWSVAPDELNRFDSIPLPSDEDLAFSRYGDQREVRALDYNLFAQEMFAGWVHIMVATIRGTGSRQLIDVGQDEGGVSDRLLNQFYATAGVSFTTNHTYWHDNALLWDSVAAKRPGIPNIVGETGYQPVWSEDGRWRYDEITGQPLLERKWALGFAAGNSGAMQWDWARDPDFGMKRSDGSAKSWEFMMRDMGRFAAAAEPFATGIVEPPIAIVLPQSLQLSVDNPTALIAQQNCVRALYQYARGAAYAVGEYQIGRLGDPKLILLPSPYGLTDDAWQTILARVRAGATLLVTGPFDGDPHLHPTGRQDQIDLPYRLAPLTLRDQILKWPGGSAQLIFARDSTTFLDRAVLPGGSTWAERATGKGRILFCPLPIELNANLGAVGDVYRYAMKMAGLSPSYSTAVGNPGILIAPTEYPDATLYVVTSETTSQRVSFKDARSGKEFSSNLGAGRAALLLVGRDGKLLASYNWGS
jgi:Beta-galactosidase